MLNAAAMHGIDLSHMWGTVDRAADGRPVRVREVCVAVSGSGRTAVMLLGEPGPHPKQGHVERVACIRAASEALRGGSISLAQTLPEPDQAWAVEAFTEAGFMRVGELAYMRRGIQMAGAASLDWLEGVSVRNVRGVGGLDETDRKLMIQALDRSYEDTLDCPELCGLRATADVLESHQATGAWNAKLWWLVMLDGEPEGCMLFNRVPEQGTVELVYLGLSKRLRGRGLGSRLLLLGLESAVRTDAGQITCAVDMRNVPARRLYTRFGFHEFGRRLAMVKRITQ
jgi:mycothiol synthase